MAAKTRQGANKAIEFFVGDRGGWIIRDRRAYQILDDMGHPPDHGHPDRPDDPPEYMAGYGRGEIAMGILDDAAEAGYHVTFHPHA